jgi:sarcosine oxidase subunit alpha
VLVEQDREFGGRLLGERAAIDSGPALAWVEAVVTELSRMPNVRLMRRTLVAGYYDHNVLTALDHSDVEHRDGRIERFWRIHAREVVLATGAIEQPFVFAHNDRPGVMLAGAARQYLNRYGVAIGREVLVATNNDDAWRTAFDLHDAGVGVAAIVDARTRIDAALVACAAQRGLRVLEGSVVMRADGGPAVRRARVGRLAANGRGVHGPAVRVDCDAIAVSSGWNPTVHLYSQAGGRVMYQPGLGCLVPLECRQRVHIVGAANAEFDLQAALEAAAAAGRLAAVDASAGTAGDAAVGRPGLRVADPTWRTASYGIAGPRRAPAVPGDRQWIDLQHDVTTADIELAVRENYVSVEHLKRYTTNGMSVDQGKTSNLNALALLAELTDRPIAEVGTTTYRPQFLPVTLGAVGGGQVGGLYAPARRLPAHRWHVAHGAELDDYGGWSRPACYRRSGESRAIAIEREVRAVRGALGLLDASPLGKIELRGRDAVTLLDRIYVNNATTLQPGQVRYGLMLNENGIVIDDGVFACLAPEHYLVSTTAANGERIAAWLEEWQQCEWPDLELVQLSVTTQWAVLTLAGSSARTVLQGLDGDIDFTAEAFPHMSIRCGTLGGRLAGMPVRVQRVSFTGELSYEISVPADRAEWLWGELMARGAAHGIEPIGIEALLVLRLEKGFLHVGSDTDGTTNPLDLGFGRIVERKTGDFVGRRSLQRAHDRRVDRRQLVGLEPIGEGTTLVAGAHLVAGEGANRRSEGFVTSAARSPTLGRWIGLALLERGAQRSGDTVRVFDQGRLVEARVVDPAFYDPAGARMNA